MSKRTAFLVWFDLLRLFECWVKLDLWFVDRVGECWQGFIYSGLRLDIIVGGK